MSSCNPINSIRGLLALLIVWHHLTYEMNVPYSFSFGNTVVLFFFILSGFGIALTWKERMGAPSTISNGVYKTFIIKRCTKIFPLQWLMLALFLLFHVNVFSFWAVPFHLTLTQSAIPLWEINFTLNMPSWFLSSLFFCYLLCPFLLRYGYRNKKSFVVLLLSALFFYSLTVWLLPESIGRRWLTYINPMARMLDFSVGMCLGLFWSEVVKGESLLGKRSATFLEVVFVVAAIVFMTYQPLFAYNQYVVLRYPIILGLIVVFTFAKGYVSQILSNRVFNWLGGISMAIYMIHTFVLHFTKDITCIPLWFNIAFTYFLVILGSHFITKYFLPRGAKGVQFLFDRAFAWRDRSKKSV